MVFDYKRFLSGIVLISIIIFSFYFNKDLFFFCAILLAIFYDLKYSKIIKINFYILFLLYLLFLLFLSAFIGYLNIFYTNTILALFIFISIFYKKSVTFLFILVLFIFLINTYSLLLSDRLLFYLIFFVSFVNDTTAYIFGKTIKGPLIIPNISPKKTWSGTISSFFISLTLLYYLNFNIYISIFISLSFFIGDIYFSYIKRLNNIKDFSNLIIGHGGALDRLDSIFIPISIAGFLTI